MTVGSADGSTVSKAHSLEQAANAALATDMSANIDEKMLMETGKHTSSFLRKCCAHDARRSGRGNAGKIEGVARKERNVGVADWPSPSSIADVIL